MVMNCKFCDKEIEQDNDKKWVTVETGKAHYWECDSPDAPRLKGKKKFEKKPYTPKQPTVDATPQLMDILGAFGKQITRLEEKIDGLITQSAFKVAGSNEVVNTKTKAEKLFEKPDEGATLRNPEDVGK